MARPFSTTDAQRIIAEHHTLLERLAAAEAQLGQCREQVKAASEEMVAREVMNVLRDIPVEELNRDKRGIRVKSLRDARFETFADLAAAPVYAITAVNGVSEDGAHTIKRIVGDMVNEIRQGMKIRLSLDNRTKEASALVLAVSKYRRLQPVAEACRELLEDNQRDIAYAIADLTVADGSLKWFFASKTKRERAADAYRRLVDSLNGAYGREVGRQIHLADTIRRMEASAAWDEFAADPIPFIHTIEDINPGILGNDDSVYGLPEELARQIQDEAFFPEGLTCELRRYQEWGVRYILHQWRVLLGDEMGLGKTVQAIAVMVSLKNTGATHFLVICPAGILTNWCREIRRMSKLSVIKLHGPEREAALAAWLDAGGVAVTTYETAACFDLPEDFHFSLTVVDEAHYIKNPEARRTSNVKRLCSHAERLLFMTGTALENKVDEMINLVRILRPDVAMELQPMAAISAAPRFQEAVAPVYYRRRREDVLTELPELIESREWCEMSAAEELAYENAVLYGSYADARRVS